MQSPILSQLQELNLPANEAKVYLALFSTGQTSAGELIKKTRLHRSVVYESLDRLIDKKLVFKVTKRKVAYFQVTNPDRLIQQIKMQERTALSLVPKLQKLLSETAPEINIYEGLEAYRKFWLDTTANLPVGTTDYVGGSIGSRWQELMGEDTERFIQLRVERKIKWKMLVFEEDAIETELLRKYPKLHEYRIIKRSATKEGNFNIFGNQSVVLHSATEPTIIEIKNSSLVKVFQNLFDILWENGKPVKNH